MIESILPPQVATQVSIGDQLPGELTTEEAMLVERAVPRRVREFAAGRHCARQALRQLGISPGSILCGPQREPIWPEGIVGSITHCTGYQAAAVAWRRDLVTIGIDAEPHAPLPPETLGQVGRPQELAWLQRAPLGTHWDKLLFSAKESVYKAWFPLTRQWLGFEEVEIAFDPDRATFQAKLLRPHPVQTGQALIGFQGRYLIQDGLILTATTLPDWGNATAEE
ncbi:MAG: 4'-phosphopantetheinyl transferase [Planctomycetales bacterium]